MTTSVHDRKGRRSVDSGYPSSPESDFLCFEMLTSDLHDTPVDPTLDVKLRNNDWVSSLSNSPLTKAYDLALFDEVDLSSTFSDYSDMSMSTYTSPENSTKYSHLVQMLSERPLQLVNKHPCVNSSVEPKDRRRNARKTTPVSLTPEDYSTYTDFQYSSKYTKIKPKVRRCLEPSVDEQKNAASRALANSSVKVAGKPAKKTKQKKRATTTTTRTSKQEIQHKRESKNSETTSAVKMTKCSTGSCVHGACQARVLSLMKVSTGNRQENTLVAPGPRLANARNKLAFALCKAGNKDARRGRDSERNSRPVLVPLSARDVALITSRINNKPLEDIDHTPHLSAPKIRAILNQHFVCNRRKSTK